MKDSLGIVPGEPLPESRFTAPTPLCPFPERWTSTDADSTEVEVSELLAALTRALQPDAVLETGTAFGETAKRIGDALTQNGHGLLYTVERDPVRAAFCNDLLIAQPVVVIESETLDWTPPTGTVFDLVWLDSYYRLRVPEFHHFRPYMRKGTIVCFHDTAPGHGGDTFFPDSDIRTAVSSLRTEIRLIHLPTPRGITLGEVIR